MALSFEDFSLKMSLLPTFRQQSLAMLPNELQQHIKDLADIQEKKDRKDAEERCLAAWYRNRSIKILRTADDRLCCKIRWSEVSTEEEENEAQDFFENGVVQILEFPAHTRYPRWLPNKLLIELQRVSATRQRITVLAQPGKPWYFFKIIIGEEFPLEMIPSEEWERWSPPKFGCPWYIQLAKDRHYEIWKYQIPPVRTQLKFLYGDSDDDFDEESDENDFGGGYNDLYQPGDYELPDILPEHDENIPDAFEEMDINHDPEYDDDSWYENESAFSPKANEDD